MLCQCRWQRPATFHNHATFCDHRGRCDFSAAMLKIATFWQSLWKTGTFGGNMRTFNEKRRNCEPFVTFPVKIPASQCRTVIFKIPEGRSQPRLSPLPRVLSEQRLLTACLLQAYAYVDCAPIARKPASTGTSSYSRYEVLPVKNKNKICGATHHCSARRRIFTFIFLEKYSFNFAKNTPFEKKYPRKISKTIGWRVELQDPLGL